MRGEGGSAASAEQDGCIPGGRAAETSFLEGHEFPLPGHFDPVLPEPIRERRHVLPLGHGVARQGVLHSHLAPLVLPQAVEGEEVDHLDLGRGGRGRAEREEEGFREGGRTRVTQRGEIKRKCKERGKRLSRSSRLASRGRTLRATRGPRAGRSSPGCTRIGATWGCPATRAHPRTLSCPFASAP